MAYADCGRVNSKEPTKTVEQLIRKCNIEVDPVDGCCLNEIVKVSKHYTNYQFIVYNSLSDHNSLLFKSARKEKKVNLFHLNNHFVAIRTIRGFFEYGYQCKHCDKLYIIRKIFTIVAPHVIFVVKLNHVHRPST